MVLTLISGPQTEPITVSEAKRQVLLDTSAGEPTASAPTATLSAVAGLVTAGVHRYLVTFVTADGETDAGEVSNAVTTILATHGKVTLSAIPLGGSAVTSRNLYRTAAGGSTYLKLAALADNSTVTYLDNIADASLTTAAPSTNTTEDPIITSLIVAVRERCEAYTRRALITQTWDLVLDRFPSGSFIEIPKPPLSSATTGITHVKYYDTAGDIQTWATANYDYDAPAGPRCARARLALSYGIDWPFTYGEIGDVQVRFIAGYGAAAAVPYMLKVGMKMDLAALYAAREGEAGLPLGVKAIYQTYKSWPTTGGR